MSIYSFQPPNEPSIPVGTWTIGLVATAGTFWLLIGALWLNTIAEFIAYGP